MQKTTATPILILLMLLLAAPAALAQKGKSKANATSSAIELKMQLKAGSTYRMWMLTDQDITQDVSGQKITVKQLMGMGYRYEVQSVDAAGTATVKMIYDSVVVRNKTPMGEMEFNSANPETGESTPGTEAYKAMMGAEFIMKLTKAGKVESITGAEEMMGKMVNGMGTMDATQKATMEQSLKKLMSNEAMAETVERAMNFYPKNPVSVGESWTQTIEIAMGMPMTVSTTYTLKSIKDGVANLEMKSTVANNANAKPMEMMGMEMSYNLSGTQKGMMQVTIADGWIRSSSLKQTMFGTMSISGENIPDMLKDIPIAVQSDISISSR